MKAEVEETSLLQVIGIILAIIIIIGSIMLVVNLSKIVQTTDPESTAFFKQVTESMATLKQRHGVCSFEASVGKWPFVAINDMTKPWFNLDDLGDIIEFEATKLTPPQQCIGSCYCICESLNCKKGLCEPLEKKLVLSGKDGNIVLGNLKNRVFALSYYGEQFSIAPHNPNEPSIPSCSIYALQS